jgi:hypothetical protein
MEGREFKLQSLVEFTRPLGEQNERAMGVGKAPNLSPLSRLRISYSCSVGTLRVRCQPSQVERRANATECRECSL